MFHMPSFVHKNLALEEPLSGLVICQCAFQTRRPTARFGTESWRKLRGQYRQDLIPANWGCRLDHTFRAPAATAGATFFLIPGIWLRLSS